jgi:carbonic anhydrase/acetyltransferase-like protein (isoleucine patch superfamily)
MGEIIKIVRGEPKIGQSVFLAPTSVVAGDVVLGDGSSVWFQAVIRGDVMPIRIGKEVNIQDGAVLHGTFGKFGVEIADRVTVGHKAVLHGCTIGEKCLIGMGAILLDGVEIGARSIVGAGSLCTQGAKFPPNSLIVGSPAKVKRALTDEEIAFLDQSADNYLLYKTWYESV